MCSFCIIPFARGRARSRAFDNVLAEARALVERGAMELVLTGVNVGTYAHDSRTLVDLVDALDRCMRRRADSDQLDRTHDH
jgi:threonylcarbamoyladenosine tRNA methylthiotransferase MtaB